MNTLRLLVCLMFVNVLNVSAQEVVVTSGNTVSGASGSVSYSCGQVFTSSNGDTLHGFATEGVMQTYEFLTLSVSDSAIHISLRCEVYPNPAREQIVLELSELIGNMHFELLDVSGALVKSGELTALQTSLPAEQWAVGMYFLRIYSSDRILQTIKIIKN